MNDETMRDYLLGKLAEPEAQRFEERILDDEELFQTLRSVEDDLVDAYARGTLDEGARQDFQQRYAGQASRVTFSRALTQRMTNVGPTANVVPIKRPAIFQRTWVWLAAAAAVAVVVASQMIHRVEPRSEPAPTVIAKRRVRVPREFPVVLVLAASRSEGEANVISIPADVERVQLRIRLDPADRFESYSAEMSSAAGVVWRAENLHAKAVGEELTLRAEVPASAMTRGSYELAVRGDAQALGFISMEVHR